MKQTNKVYKRLFLDIETAPNLILAWGIGKRGVMWDHDCIVKERQIILAAWKWQHEKTVHVLDWGAKQDDGEICRRIVPVLDEADQIIAHNGNHFDLPWLRTRCLQHGVPCNWSYKSLDTLAEARKRLYLNSTRLDYLSKFLGRKGKIKTDFGLWKRVMAKDPKALAEMTRYCITPDHKLLGADLRWKPAGEFRTGDVVLGFEERGPSRAYRKAEILSIKYDVQPVFRVTLSSGHTIRATKEHQWLVTRARNTSKKQAYSYHWRTTDKLIVRNGAHTYIPKVLDVWTEDTSREAGWVAGIFDGEGSLARSRVDITVSQKPGLVVDRITQSLESLIPNMSRKTTVRNQSCQTVWLKGCMADKLKFLGRVRPERLIQKVDFDRLGRMESRNGLEEVVSVVPAGVERIIIIETSTGTFVCDGYPMHNCRRDVLELEAVYERLAPYLATSTHRGVLEGGEKWQCPLCGSEDVKCNKTRCTAVGTVQRQMKCKVCHRYYSICNKAYEEMVAAKVDEQTKKKET